VAQGRLVAASLFDAYYDAGACTFGSQNADGMALATGLVPEQQREAFVEAVVQRIEADEFHPRCHMLCGRYLLEGLAEHGARETAYRMVTVAGAPGWLDLVARSGGTIGCHFYPGRGSLNHPALGLAAGWLLRWVAGIRLSTGTPGRLDVELDPWLPDEMDWLDVTVPTPAGIVGVSARREDGNVNIETRVPAPVHMDGCGMSM
jgi:alpha-L-rhamnosidase